MRWRRLREEAGRLVAQLPFQRIRDSPTIKYYTDWTLFRGRLDLPYERCMSSPPHMSEILMYTEPKILDNLGIEVRVLDGDDRYVFGGPFTLVKPEDKMQALHISRWSSGIYIHVPKGYRGERPLRISTCGGLNGYSGHHIYIECEGEADILLYDYMPRTGVGLKTTVVEGYVGPGARLNIASAVDYSPVAPAYHLKRIAVMEGGRAESTVLISNGLMAHVREDFIVDAGGSVEVREGSIARGRSRMDIITNIIHRGRESRSRVVARGVAMERGRTVHRGTIRIEREAANSSSDIDYRVLVLSPEASGNAVPMLEIRTGVVKSAHHSAAVSNIDEDQLFYLRSRGVDLETARLIVVRGMLEVLLRKPWDRYLDLYVKRFSPP